MYQAQETEDTGSGAARGQSAQSSNFGRVDGGAAVQQPGLPAFPIPRLPGTNSGVGLDLRVMTHPGPLKRA